MDELRLILLIIGCLFVLGIYFWDVFFKKEPRRKDSMLDAVDELPDLPAFEMKQADSQYDYTESLADIGSLISHSRDDTPLAQDAPSMQTDNAEPAFSSEMSVKDYESNFKAEDDFNVFAAVQDDLEQHESEPQDLLTKEVATPEPENNDIVSIETEAPSDEVGHEPGSADEPDRLEESQELGKASDDIVVLYVTSPAQTLFNGLSVSKAADEVGMVYGHMNVFHHFGPGKLHSGQPLFSMANMYEPGSFDLGRMADLRTKGVVLFMYSPASIEASVVFELFLNTTQRIAELLGGEVRTRDNRFLDSDSAQQLREQAETLASST